MEKRGQITLFIVLGVMLVGVIAFLLLLAGNTRTSDKTKALNFDRSTINLYVTGCLDRVGTSSLILLGKQGGYITTDYFLQTEKY